jgi:putative FmdB family regulatory protein
MPLYEYQCSKCNKIFEVRQKFSDPPVTVHEGCGGTVERLLSAPAFQLKGSGWYATDYAKSGSQKKSDTGSNGSHEGKDGDGKGSESKAGESKSDSKSTESKSESKSESKTPASEGKSDSKPASSTTKKD